MSSKPCAKVLLMQHLILQLDTHCIPNKLLSRQQVLKKSEKTLVKNCHKIIRNTSLISLQNPVLDFFATFNFMVGLHTLYLKKNIVYKVPALKKSELLCQQLSQNYLQSPHLRTPNPGFNQGFTPPPFI
jgi:hypothetical protein